MHSPSVMWYWKPENRKTLKKTKALGYVLRRGLIALKNINMDENESFLALAP